MGVVCLAFCAANWAWNVGGGRWGITVGAVHVRWTNWWGPCSNYKGVYSEQGSVVFANWVPDGRIRCAPGLRQVSPYGTRRKPDVVLEVVTTGFSAGAAVPGRPPGVADGRWPSPTPRRLDEPAGRTRTAGFGAEWGLVPDPTDGRVGAGNRGVWVPWWFLTAVFAVAPVRGWAGRGWVALARAARHPPGTCHGCGYDLRASPERCPECGRPVGATAGRQVAGAALSAWEPL